MIANGVDADPNPSAFLGVTNTQIQLACPGKPVGSFYLHEAMLVRPVAYALFVDALTHDGPGGLHEIWATRVYLNNEKVGSPFTFIEPE